MRQHKLYQAIASRQLAIENCIKTGNKEWQERHETAIDELVRDHLPHGFGTHYDNVRSSANKLVFNTSYHHMNDGGMYDGWSAHSVIVRPSLALGTTLQITGRDRNGIKDYIAEVFSSALDKPVEN